MDPSAETEIRPNLWHEAELIREGNPSIYLIKGNSDTVVREDSKIRKCEIGTKNSKNVTEKVIMFVGETGAGKTTMINRVVNYLLGVKWEDKGRYRLTTDKEEASGEETSEIQSKTKWISSYTFHQTKNLNFKVTLIDTPGFGDTGGKERDKFITSQIKDFFHTTGERGIDHIDAVAFVLVASAKRLTETQKYIFESVLNLFGKDISENIFLFITHAETENIEDGIAPVIEAAQSAMVPFAHVHIFNNVALFRDKNKTSSRRASSSTSRNKEMWDFGGEDIDNFFAELEMCEPKSIFLSAEVLAERSRLEIAVRGIPANITSYLVEVKKLEEEEKALQKYMKEMDDSQDFTYIVNEEVQVKTELISGKRATVCLNCSRTCHYPCKASSTVRCQSFGSPFMLYDLMRKLHHGPDKEARCYVCPGHCGPEHHSTGSYRYEPKIEKVTKTRSDVKQRYDLAKEGKSKTESMIGEVKEKLMDTRNSLENCVGMLGHCLNRLDEIALKSDSLSVSEHLASVIKDERLKGQPGWEDRVKELEKLYETEKVKEGCEASGK